MQSCSRFWAGLCPLVFASEFGFQFPKTQVSVPTWTAERCRGFPADPGLLQPDGGFTLPELEDGGCHSIWRWGSPPLLGAPLDVMGDPVSPKHDWRAATCRNSVPVSQIHKKSLCQRQTDRWANKTGLRLPSEELELVSESMY